MVASVTKSSLWYYALKENFSPQIRHVWFAEILVRKIWLKSKHNCGVKLASGHLFKLSNCSGPMWEWWWPVSVQSRYSEVYSWSIKLLSEKDCSFIRSKRNVWYNSLLLKARPFQYKPNKLVCFVKVEIIRKNLKVCFSFCLNSKLARLEESARYFRVTFTGLIKSFL